MQKFIVNPSEGGHWNFNLSLKYATPNIYNSPSHLRVTIPMYRSC